MQQLLEASGATANRDVLRDILRTAAGLAGDDADRLDLKITAAALKEMRAAFAMFEPLKGTPKVDHLRLGPHPARRPALRPGPTARQHLAEAGWFVITGAGPGIMQAGAEGRGPRASHRRSASGCRSRRRPATSSPGANAWWR